MKFTISFTSYLKVLQHYHSLKILQKGMLIDKQGEANQLIRRNRQVVHYGGVELEPSTRI